MWPSSRTVTRSGRESRGFSASTCPPRRPLEGGLERVTRTRSVLIGRITPAKSNSGVKLELGKPAPG